ncbi:MAG: flagellar hook-length control protein FliK [Paenibacillaceae bacterium]
MVMPNVQVQTPSSKASSATSNTTSTTTATTSTSGEAKSGTFVEALIKVIEGQAAGEQASGEQMEVSTDAAASMVAAILPSAIVNLISSQPSSEDIKGTVQALIQVIQSMNPEQLKSLMGQPELQNWMANVEQILNQQQNSTVVTVKIQDVSATVAQPIPLESAPSEDFVAVLNRYLGMLASNPTHPIVQQLGSELKKITVKLSESFPALTTVPNNNVVINSMNPIVPQVNSDVQVTTTKSTESVPALTTTTTTTTTTTATTTATTVVEATKLEGAKSDKPASTSFSNIQLSESSTSSHTSGETLNQQQPKGTQSQLLQRLASISPNITATVETTVVSDASAMTVDTSAIEQDDTLLTLAQISGSPKLASTSSDAKLIVPSVSAQAFAEEMTRFIVKNMSINQLNGSSEAKISLVPEHLGQVDVKISVINGQITAHFMAESAHARDLLELQLPQLRASLQQQGLQVDKLNVEQQNNLASSLFQDQRHQQTSQHFAQNGKKNAKDYDQFGADFSIEMDQAVRMNRLAYGNTFNATA